MDNNLHCDEVAPARSYIKLATESEFFNYKLIHLFFPWGAYQNRETYNSIFSFTVVIHIIYSIPFI